MTGVGDTTDAAAEEMRYFARGLVSRAGFPGLMTPACPGTCQPVLASTGQGPGDRLYLPYYMDVQGSFGRALRLIRPIEVGR